MPGLGLQDVPQLTDSKTSSFPNLLINHVEHLGHPVLGWEPSSGLTALCFPFLKTPLKGPHGKLRDALPLIPGTGFSHALREISSLLMLQRPGSGDVLRATTPTELWCGLRSPIFFTQGEPRRQRVPLRCPSPPPHAPRSTSAQILSSQGPMRSVTFNSSV